MTEAVKIMEYAEAAGHHFYMEGENLRITKGNHLPASFKSHLVEYKKDLLGLLRQDEAAKQSGLMIGIPGTLYTWTVSRFSTAYIEHYNGEWVAWRETYQKGKAKAISHKFIAKGNTFAYVLEVFRKYMTNVSKHWDS